jgi:hypothetical protein
VFPQQLVPEQAHMSWRPSYVSSILYDRRWVVPEVWPEAIEWDDTNSIQATAHGITAEEIEQVIANGPVYRRNKRGRAGDLLAAGTTDGGRRVVVAVAWDAARRTVRPITAWEDR